MAAIIFSSFIHIGKMSSYWKTVASVLLHVADASNIFSRFLVFLWNTIFIKRVRLAQRFLFSSEMNGG